MSKQTNTATIHTNRLPSSLEDITKYQHPALIERLRVKADIPYDDGVTLFEDTKMFLYLCASTTETLGPSPAIDECWHNFILYTEDYAEFCNRYFGKFIHHRPRYPNDPPGDGSPAYRTLALAQELLGEPLSLNWTYTTETIDCNPSTNCQTTPTGCGSSPTGS